MSASVADKTGRRTRRFGLAAWTWTIPVLIFLVVFFVVPLIQNFWRSLFELNSNELSTFYYDKLLTDPFYLGVLAETFRVSFFTTVICLLIGYPVSYFMVRYAGKWNGLIVFCLVAPLLTSIIMRTFGWTVLLSRRGLLNTFLLDWGIIPAPLNVLDKRVMVYIGLVHVLAPFMILSISAVLQGVDVRLEEAARILGAGKLRTFLTVTLPLSLDGIATGCILVFVLTNGSFLTMLLLGGGQIRTLSLLIYQQFNLSQDVGFAAAMGNVLLLFALVCLAIQMRVVRRRGVRT